MVIAGAATICWCDQAPAGKKGRNTLEILVSPYGCKSRPINAEPGRSVASLAATSVTTSSMRRHASAWAVRFSLETVLSVVQGVNNPEDCIVVVAIGRDDADTGGVVEHGTFATGGPATWEALSSPRENTGATETRRSISDETAFRMHAALGQEQASGDEVGRTRGTTEAAAEGEQGVGGLHKSDDVGERKAPGPGRAKAARAETNFRRETCSMHRHRRTCHRNY